MEDKSTYERLAKLKGYQEHMATEADVERVRTDVERVRTGVERVRTDLGRDIEQVRSELSGMKWAIGIGVSVSGVIAGLVAAALS